MTTTPTEPMIISDDEQIPAGVALVGANPNSLTVASVAWSVETGLTVTPSADTLTATVTATPGTDGTFTVSAILTLSDGSTLNATGSLVVTASAGEEPLSAVIVFGTPTTEGS